MLDSTILTITGDDGFLTLLRSNLRELVGPSADGRRQND